MDSPWKCLMGGGVNRVRKSWVPEKDSPDSEEPPWWLHDMVRIPEGVSCVTCGIGTLPHTMGRCEHDGWNVKSVAPWRKRCRTMGVRKPEDPHGTDRVTIFTYPNTCTRLLPHRDHTVKWTRGRENDASFVRGCIGRRFRRRRPEVTVRTNRRSWKDDRSGSMYTRVMRDDDEEGIPNGGSVGRQTGSHRKSEAPAHVGSEMKLHVNSLARWLAPYHAHVVMQRA